MTERLEKLAIRLGDVQTTRMYLQIRSDQQDGCGFMEKHNFEAKNKALADENITLAPPGAISTYSSLFRAHRPR